MRLRTSPVTLSTSENEDHAWVVTLQTGADELERARAVLSGFELERAARFSSATMADRWVVAHAACRQILARYLDQKPREVTIAAGANGKPYLAGAAVKSQLHFNFSRSHQRALLVVSRRGEIGADIECCTTIPDIESITQRFFCAAECRTIFALSGAPRVQAFYRCWTVKEAVLKASGDGLRLALNSVEVSLLDPSRPRLISIAGDCAEASRWTLHHRQCGDGYTAAIAYRDAPRNLRWYTFSDRRDAACPERTPPSADTSVSRSAEKSPGI